MHSLSDRRWHHLVIGGIRSTLFKGHPVEERFQEHIDLLNVAMMDTCVLIYNKDSCKQPMWPNQILYNVHLPVVQGFSNYTMQDPVDIR